MEMDEYIRLTIFTYALWEHNIAMENHNVCSIMGKTSMTMAMLNYRRVTSQPQCVFSLVLGGKHPKTFKTPMDYHIIICSN